MSSPVPIIKERLSIIDVISSYLSVEKAGKNYKAKCPFHNEKTPSFFISEERGSYYCFGCGAKGDIFSFVEQFEGVDFLGALKMLAEKAGVSLSEHRFKVKDETEIYYEIMEQATKFFESNLFSKVEANAYLKSRGLTDTTIQNFRIGYALDGWRSLLDFLTKKGYRKEDIEKVGLIKNGNGSTYDRFRSRIMFPLSDSSGRVIAFSGRIFGLPAMSAHAGQAGKEEQEPAKYINSPDTPLFNKSNVLFGIDKAKTAIRTRGYSLIVEGQFDVIMSHQAGFTNTLAVSGTAFTDSVSDSESKINNLGLIRRLSSNIIFAYDGDSAGIRAASRSAMIALSLDMQVKIAVMPEGQDPADIILSDSQKWKDIIKNSVNIIEFHINRICKNTNDIRQRGKQVRDIIFPFLLMVKSSIEKSAYINMIHNHTSISEKAIIEDFENYERGQDTTKKILVESKEVKTTKERSRRDHLERKLIGIIFWSEQKGDTLELDSFKSNIGIDKFNNIYELHKPFAENLIFETEMWYGEKKDNLSGDMKELLLNLEEEILNDELVLLLDQINKNERDGNSDTSSLLANYQKIKGRIEEIKNKRSK